MSTRKVLLEREKAWTALLLAWIAGVVDAVGYLVLASIFTANMSGNSVKMGIFVGQEQWAVVLPYLLPVLLFPLGVFIAVLIIDVVMLCKMYRGPSLVLSLEALMLLVYVLLGSHVLFHGVVQITRPWEYYPLVALSVIAMGMQTAALRSVSGHIVRTTYVTGMLTEMAEGLATYIFLRIDLWRMQQQDKEKDIYSDGWGGVSWWLVFFFAGIWFCYVFGAIWGGYFESRWSLNTLLLPIGILIALVVVDIFHPLHLLPIDEEGQDDVEKAKRAC